MGASFNVSASVSVCLWQCGDNSAALTAYKVVGLEISCCCLLSILQVCYAGVLLLHCVSFPR